MILNKIGKNFFGKFKGSEILKIFQIYKNIIENKIWKFIFKKVIPVLSTILLYMGLLNKVKFIRKSISSIGRTSQSSNDGDSTLQRSIRLFSGALIIAWLPLVLYRYFFYIFSLLDKFNSQTCWWSL